MALLTSSGTVWEELEQSGRRLGQPDQLGTLLGELEEWELWPVEGWFADACVVRTHHWHTHGGEMVSPLTTLLTYDTDLADQMKQRTPSVANSLVYHIKRAMAAHGT